MLSQSSRLTAQSLTQVLRQVMDMRNRHRLGDYLQPPGLTLHLTSGLSLTGELLDFQEEAGQILLATPQVDGCLHLLWTQLHHVAAVTTQVRPEGVHRLSGGLMPLPLDAESFDEARLTRVSVELGGALSRRLEVPLEVVVQWGETPSSPRRAQAAEVLSRICVVLHELAEVELRRVQMAEGLRRLVLGEGDIPLAEVVDNTLSINLDLAAGMTGPPGLADLKMAMEEVL